MEVPSSAGMESEGIDGDSCVGISSNMWWANVRGAVGQRINPGAIACFVGVLFGNERLVIPHVAVRDVRYIDWAELKRKGFEGVVFDKDNTLTVPYSLSLWPLLGSSLETCKALFGSNVAVFSNSAGNSRATLLEGKFLSSRMV